MVTTRIGIVGYGNLGRGAEAAIRQNADLELAAVFTRRDPNKLVIATDGVPVVHTDDLPAWRDRVDVLILCGGSATDLPQWSPRLATDFCIVDSFDTHAKIPEHFDAVDAAARAGGTVGVIAVGWDPGLFSLNRLYAEAVLPSGETATFWGPGVSQGHSDAIRRIEGVADARQYTVPVEAAVERARIGDAGLLTARERHLRQCYVVAEAGANRERIAETIKTMPDYFADYDTTVTFITAEELACDHAGMPHGGFVIRSGHTGLSGENGQVIEYTLRLDSNPEFTSAVLVAYARAAHRLAARGETGARTVLDIPPALLSPTPPAELRKRLL
ncbi:MAG: diaminopimelate dehydrogenase [Promicromonosporaceae bacterium]|nr:diaminopimelate dehydrogenase [Promicromonosporaceae bacterium]